MKNLRSYTGIYWQCQPTHDYARGSSSNNNNSKLLLLLCLRLRRLHPLRNPSLQAWTVPKMRMQSRT